MLRLKQAAEELTKGKFGVQVDVLPGDEVGDLAAQFNTMSAELKRFEELKNSLTHMLVHDLKNPLSIIYGGMDYLKADLDSKLSEHDKKIFRMVFRSATELQRMVGNILDIQKMRESNGKLAMEPFVLAEVAQQVIDQENIIAVSEEKTISLEVIGDVPLINADKELIRRVIVNLLNNALKFTPSHGAIGVRISYSESEKSVFVQVKDTGEGISKENLETVFGKFVQVGPERSKIGHGLGLTFCKMMVEAHGGKIWAESDGKNKGSAFIFSLPA